ncbi:MAG: DUF4345 domain-containing protein [Myxococcota bacterium]|nr:DUF4345 domain-containing protein [Myxococcota bacterium]
MTASNPDPRALERWIIWLDAVVFSGIGLAFLFWPQELAGFLGIELTNTTALNDFRAVYGGVPAGLAAFLFMAVSRPSWTVPALWMALLTLTGLAVGRVLSEALDGTPGFIVQALQVAEIAGALLCALGLIRIARRRRR